MYIYIYSIYEYLYSSLGSFTQYKNYMLEAFIYLKQVQLFLHWVTQNT